MPESFVDLTATLIGITQALSVGPPSWTSTPEFLEFVRDVWHFTRHLIIVVAMIIFVSSLDDFFVDISYWALRLYRLLLRPFRRPVKQSVLEKHPEQRIAIMVPAWEEAEVIGHMIDFAAKNIIYKNYDIFVGVYPNDPDTKNVVMDAQANHSNVHICETPHDGPSTKADCLNWIMAGIFDYEERTGKPYDIFVLQDAEDVIHAFSLKLLNFHIPENDMVQLPVRSAPRRLLQFVASQYMDEFAELHMKDMVVRSYMTNNVPSAGVGTGFSRHAIMTLKNSNGGYIFSETSLTEDYEIGMRLQEYGLKGAFVSYRAKVPDLTAKKKGKKPPMKTSVVAIQEYFPHTFRTSVRQKTRWILGISFVGWETIRWRGEFANRYWLMRDRKVLITAPTAALGYLIVINVLLTWALMWLNPELRDLPPLIDEGHWIWFFIYIDFFFFANRLLHRALFVGLAHGQKYVWLSPVRAVVSNIITFFAWFRAARRYAWSGMTGARLKWEKTVHAFPEQIRASGRWVKVFSPSRLRNSDDAHNVPEVKQAD